MWDTNGAWDSGDAEESLLASSKKTFFIDPEDYVVLESLSLLLLVEMGKV